MAFTLLTPIQLIHAQPYKKMTLSHKPMQLALILTNLSPNTTTTQIFMTLARETTLTLDMEMPLPTITTIS